MSNVDNFSALPNDLDDAKVSRWSALFAKVTLAVFAVGAIAAGIIWVVASNASTQDSISTGQDISILTLCITFALMIALMSIRAVLRAER